MKKLICVLSCVLLLASCSYSTSIGNTTVCECDSTLINTKTSLQPYVIIGNSYDVYNNLITTGLYNTETKITCIITYQYDYVCIEGSYRWVCIDTTVTMYDSNGSIIE